MVSKDKREGYNDDDIRNSSLCCMWSLELWLGIDCCILKVLLAAAIFLSIISFMTLSYVWTLIIRSEEFKNKCLLLHLVLYRMNSTSWCRLLVWHYTTLEFLNFNHIYYDGNNWLFVIHETVVLHLSLYSILFGFDHQTFTINSGHIYNDCWMYLYLPFVIIPYRFSQFWRFLHWNMLFSVNVYYIIASFFFCYMFCVSWYSLITCSIHCFLSTLPSSSSSSSLVKKDHHSIGWSCQRQSFPTLL